jgi:hypothetical protein
MHTLSSKGPDIRNQSLLQLIGCYRNKSKLNTAYTELITSTANIAQGHVDIADTLNTQVVDVLKALERKNDEMKKKVGYDITCGYRSLKSSRLPSKSSSSTSFFRIGTECSLNVSRSEVCSRYSSLPEIPAQSKQKV